MKISTELSVDGGEYVTKPQITHFPSVALFLQRFPHVRAIVLERHVMFGEARFGQVSEHRRGVVGKTLKQVWNITLDVGAVEKENK